MVAFNTVKVGDELWDVHSYRMGNTTMRAMGSWRVRIVGVNDDKEVVWVKVVVDPGNSFPVTAADLNPVPADPEGRQGG